MLHTFVAVAVDVVWFLHLYQPQFISGHNKRRLLPLSPSWLPKTEATTQNPKPNQKLPLSTGPSNIYIYIFFYYLPEELRRVAHFLTANNNFALAKLYFML